MTKWQVLDLIDFQGYIGNDRGVLLVGEHRVPASDLAVVLLGQKSTWGFGLVDKAVRNDFAVLVCDWRNVPIAQLSGWSENSRVVARHLAQAALSEPRRKSAWKSVVKAKVHNQACVLEIVGSPKSLLLENLAKKVRSGDPENMEGQAAAAYFRSLFGESFRRNQDSTDLVNSSLNYGYTLLRGIVMREVLAAGLCPSIGMFHRNRANTYALADDLIEPFRPLIDIAVSRECMRHSELGKELKSALVQTLRQPFTSEGASVATAIRDACQSYALYVEGDRARLKLPVWDNNRERGGEGG